MFPYPSGRLHLGHVRIYTSGDILARFSRLMAKNKSYVPDFSHVIYPMGFDSFGLPAENAALERGMSPEKWTNSNIRIMKQQLDDLALQFDWREATSNRNFYKWTQELFLKLMDHGLVYKSYAQVNWDPVDKTVLADEQVDENGRSWRSGSIVERRYLRQWFVKVNSMTNAIYKAEDVNPDTWRDILAIQRNWIGQPTGWLFYLPISTKKSGSSDTMPVFTRNPEYFASNSSKLLISPDHWLEKVYNVSKIGKIDNPFNGEPLPVVLTDDVKQLPPSTLATLSNETQIDSDIQRDQVILFAKLNDLGGYFTSDKYRDWLISRQRFWGTPIPAIDCDNCGTQGVPRHTLPVALPSSPDFAALKSNLDCKSKHGDIVAPLDKLAPEEWLQTECPSCGSVAKRECETFDTLFDSSWYFLRYASEPIKDGPFDRDSVRPVWCYIGGKEHACMHLFYARFITHFLHSIKEISFREPFADLLVQGVVKSKTYKLNGKYITKFEADSIKEKEKLTIEYEKMSKSKGNGVDPQELLDNYGTDATRFCLMSYANPRSERLWRSNEEEFRDVMIFLRRVALSVEGYSDLGLKLISGGTGEKNRIKIKELSKEVLKLRKMDLTDTRNKCSVDIFFHIQEGGHQFRQCISAMHILTGVIRTNMNTSAVYTLEFAEALAAQIIWLNPFVPHLSEELWLHFCQSMINPLRTCKTTPYNTSLQASDQPWPLPDYDYGRSKCFQVPKSM